MIGKLIEFSLGLRTDSVGHAREGAYGAIAGTIGEKGRVERAVGL